MSTAKSEAVAPTVDATPEEVKSFREKQAEEWGQFVAVQPITVNGVLAYLAGDPVPASNVERHKYLEQGLVAKAESKAAQDIVSAINTAASDPGVVDLGEPVNLAVSVK